MATSLPDERPPWPDGGQDADDEAYGVAFLVAAHTLRATWLRLRRTRSIDDEAASRLALSEGKITEADALFGSILDDLLERWQLASLMEMAWETATDEGRAMGWVDGALADYPDEAFALGIALGRLARHGRDPAELEDFQIAYERLIADGVPQMTRIAFSALAMAVSGESAIPGELSRFATTFAYLHTRRADRREVAKVVGRRWPEAKLADLLAPMAYDEQTTLVALRACLEASALCGRAFRKIDPPDFGIAAYWYCIGRRLQPIHAGAAEDVLRAATNLLIFGREETPAGQDRDGPPQDWQGPLYHLGQREHGDVPDEVERERRAIDFCERFLAILDGLPAEALIANPGKAIQYARKIALGRSKGIGSHPSTVALARDPDDPTVEADEDEALLALLDEDGGGLPHWEIARARYVGGERVADLAAAHGITPRAILYRLEAFLSAARDLVEEGVVRPRGERAQAEAFLRTLLADGPVPATVVREEADRLHMAWRTVRRAKERLGIRSVRLCGTHGWAWTL